MFGKSGYFGRVFGSFWGGLKKSTVLILLKRGFFEDGLCSILGGLPAKFSILKAKF